MWVGPRASPRRGPQKGRLLLAGRLCRPMLPILYCMEPDSVVSSPVRRRGPCCVRLGGSSTSQRRLGPALSPARLQTPYRFPLPPPLVESNKSELDEDLRPQLVPARPSSTRTGTAPGAGRGECGRAPPLLPAPSPCRRRTVQRAHASSGMRPRPCRCCLHRRRCATSRNKGRTNHHSPTHLSELNFHGKQSISNQRGPAPAALEALLVIPRHFNNTIERQVGAICTLAFF